MPLHNVKSWPEFFEQIWYSTRTHDLRFNDRNYQVGDHLVLQEWDPKKERYTGAFIVAEVSSITSDDIPCAVSRHGLAPGFCILSLKKIDNYRGT